MRFMIFVAVVLLTGCSSSSPPETVRYLLRAPQPTAQRVAVETPNVGIGRVIVAPYLKQLGVVLETAPGQVHAARHHLWAEPFDRGVMLYLRQSLSAAMGADVSIDPALSGTWEYRLDVRFEEFHGTGSGDVRMTGEYSWTDVAQERAVQRRVFADVERLSGNGYGAMVEAHEALLARLVESMAETVPRSVAASVPSDSE